MTGKRRLSATVDREMLEAGSAAVAEGRAESVSAWVNDALCLKVAHDKRMQALDAFLAAYESAHGEITDDEMKDAERRARARATVVRGAPAPHDRPSRRRRGNA